MNTNELDKAIPVDNPLEPEKGGYYKAFMERRDYQPDRPYYTLSENSGEAASVFFDSGLKVVQPKLDLATGKHLPITFGTSVLWGDQFFLSRGHDIRALSYQTIKSLGLEFKDPKRPDTVVNWYGYKNKDFLVSLDELKDSELLKSLNKAAKNNNNYQPPKFDDALYAPAFERLNDYLNIFKVKLRDRPEADHLAAFDSEFIKRNQGNSINKCGFAAIRQYDHNFGVNKNKDCLKDIVPAAMPLSTVFRDENAFLKGGAIVLAKRLLRDNPNFAPIFKIDEHEVDFVKSFTSVPNWPRENFLTCITGCMIAAQLGAPKPVTQNDINWFNSINISDQEVKTAIGIATKATEFLNSKFVEVNFVEKPINKDLWQDWKKSHENLALQLATPSIQELLKNQAFDLTRDNVITALNNLTSQKVNAVGQSKEPIKEALKNDEAVAKNSLDKTFPKAGSSHTSFFDTFLKENIVTKLKDILYFNDPNLELPLKEYSENFGARSLRSSQCDSSFKDSFAKLDHLLSSNGVVIKYVDDFGDSVVRLSSDIPYGPAINHHIEFFSGSDAFPKPMHFKNETDFIKAASVMLANEKFESYVNPKLKHSTSRAFLTEATGYMLAHQLGAPVTQNDINRLSRWYCHALYIKNRQDPFMDFDPKSYQQQLSQSFKEAENIANCISQARTVDNSPTNNTWADWVSNRTSLDKGQSQSEIKEIPSAISKEEPLKNIQEITEQKSLIVDQHKEPIKAALSQDQALSQKVPELVFDLQPQKLSDLIKASEKKGKSTKRKGAER